MVSQCRQMLGFSLGIIGFLGSIVICALPMWRVTAFIGANIVTAQVIWEGLWMNCVTQSTGQMQCKIYDSLLALQQDLQAARALVVIAIIVGVFAILLSISGGKCTNFIEDEASKAKVALASGVIFIIAGVLVLVPVCWTANTVIRDFYNPLLTNAQRRASVAMASVGLQILGSVLAFLGWVGGILTCALPMWRVTAFIGNNIVTSQTMWEGIWLSCVVQSTGQMQCKVYDSMLALTSDLQAARALTVVSVVVGVAGLFMAFAGGKCTNFMADEAGKARASVAAGVVLMVSGVLCLVPVSWTASSIIHDFYNPLLNDAQRRELGGALYVGWGSGLLLLLGGALLCTSCPPKKGKRSASTLRYHSMKIPKPSSQSDSVPSHKPPTPRSLTPTKTYI
ncbi:claudin-like protein ZF-A89 [Clupea harengus]|uniref:Claudin-like protein ZF-A89 n=1 Tax=Clupea harengus TaxID=7950 RepID=A0A6P3W302_CLUHA|nr:claudin-like protein ZF-A89 [Clupea harengus]